MKIGRIILAAIWAAMWPLAAGAIDPGTATGALTVDGTVVPLVRTYAHLHDNAEGWLDTKKEMRVLVTDREVAPESIAGLNPFFTLSDMVKRGTVRGVLVRFDPANTKSAVVTVLYPAKDERNSLANKTISDSTRGPFEQLDLSDTRVSGGLNQSSEGNRELGWPAEAYRFSFSAPLFKEPTVTATLKGKQALNSPQVKAVLAKTAAMAAGDFDKVKRLCTDRSVREMEGFMAQGGREESSKMMTEAGKEMAQAVKNGSLTLVVRGNRASLLIRYKDSNSLVGLVKANGMWLVD